MVNNKSYYEILEVRDDASQEVIKMAYKALCLKYHPDTTKIDKHESYSRMQKVNEAYEVLSKPDKRARYDQDLFYTNAQTRNQYTNQRGPSSEQRSTSWDAARSQEAENQKRQREQEEKRRNEELKRQREQAEQQRRQRDYEEQRRSEELKKKREREVQERVRAEQLRKQSEQAEQRRRENEKLDDEIRLENQKKAREARNEARLVRRARWGVLLKSYGKKAAILMSILLICIFSYIFLLKPMVAYGTAMDYISTDNYDEAILIFEELGSYKDSQEMILECKYQKAKKLSESGYSEILLSLYQELGDYKDSEAKGIEYQGTAYMMAMDYLNKGNYKEAISIFEELGGFKDSKEIVAEYKYPQAEEYYSLDASFPGLDEYSYRTAIALTESLGDYKESEKLAIHFKYRLAIYYMDRSNYYFASQLLQELGEYNDSKKLLVKCEDELNR